VLDRRDDRTRVTRVLDAIRIANPAIRFYQASSSGDVRQGPRGPPPDRDDAAVPRSPYGVAKVYGTVTIKLPGEYGLHASSGMLFNHESPRRGLEFVTRKSPTERRASPAASPTSSPRNLDAQRDWGFAADYVRAMWLMLQQDKPDDFVVAP